MPAPALPAAPPPIVRQAFDTGTDGWVALGDIAKVDRANIPADANKPAGSALRFEYSVDKQSLNLLVLPVAPGAWARAGRLAFTVKTSAPTTLALSVQEKAGGRWSAVVHCPGTGWQDVRLDSTDFQLSRDPGAPADPDNHCDLAAAEQLLLLDFAQVAVRAEGPLAGLFPTTPGPRTLWLRDFTVDSRPTDIDGLAAPQLGWVPLGGTTLAKVGAGDSPLGTPALEATLAVGPAKIAGLMRPLPEAILAGANGLRMKLAASDALALVIQIEDAAGGKFSTTVEVPGAKQPKTVDIGFDQLVKSADSKTDRLDRQRIRQVLILDGSGLTDGTERTRTLWTAGWEAK